MAISKPTIAILLFVFNLCYSLNTACAQDRASSGNQSAIDGWAPTSEAELKRRRATNQAKRADQSRRSATTTKGNEQSTNRDQPAPAKRGFQSTFDGGVDVDDSKNVRSGYDIADDTSGDFEFDEDYLNPGARPNDDNQFADGYLDDNRVDVDRRTGERANRANGRNRSDSTITLNPNDLEFNKDQPTLGNFWDVDEILGHISGAIPRDQYLSTLEKEFGIFAEDEPKRDPRSRVRRVPLSPIPQFPLSFDVTPDYEPHSRERGFGDADLTREDVLRQGRAQTGRSTQARDDSRSQENRRTRTRRELAQRNRRSNRLDDQAYLDDRSDLDPRGLDQRDLDRRELDRRRADQVLEEEQRRERLLLAQKRARWNEQDYDQYELQGDYESRPVSIRDDDLIRRRADPRARELNAQQQRNSESQNQVPNHIAGDGKTHEAEQKPPANDAPAEKDEKPESEQAITPFQNRIASSSWPFLCASFLFLVSLAFNAWLFWMARDIYNRYQDAVEDLGEFENREREQASLSLEGDRYSVPARSPVRA